jgi:hypothetical protein
MVSFTPRPLYTQGKSLWYPVGRRLSGPQSRSGRGGEEKNSQYDISQMETREERKSKEACGKYKQEDMLRALTAVKDGLGMKGAALDLTSLKPPLKE